MLPLKYISSFWGNLKMSLTDCETNLVLTGSANCFMLAGAIQNQGRIFTITDAKHYVLLATLSIQDI